MGDVTTSAFVVIKAKRSQYGREDPDTGLRPVVGGNAVRMTKSRPSKLQLDELAIRVTFRIPEEAFAPITPLVQVTIPDEFVMKAGTQITVEPEDADA